MQVLAQAYDIFVAPHTGESVTYAGPLRTPDEASRAAIAQARIFVDQIMPMEGQGTLDGVPADARRLHVPLVDGSFLWPFSGARHPDSLQRYGSYHPFYIELGDSWLLKRMARGASPDQAVADYLVADIAKDGRLDRRYELAMELQAMRDGETHYRFTPLITEHFRTERLFRTPYHLEWRLSQHMLLTLLDDLDVPEAAKFAALTYGTKSLFAGSDLPVHPKVAAHFGLTWTDATTRVCFWRETMVNFEEYARRFAKCEAYPEMDIAVDAALRSLPDGPELLQGALEKLPDSPWGLHALAVLHIRGGRFRRAMKLLRRVAELHPNFAGVYAAMHECLVGLGRDAAACEALQEEVRRQPHRVIYRLRLAQAFRAAGRIAEARDEAQIVLALQPDHAKAQKMLRGLRYLKSPV